MRCIYQVLSGDQLFVLSKADVSYSLKWELILKKCVLLLLTEGDNATQIWELCTAAESQSLTKARKLYPWNLNHIAI